MYTQIQQRIIFVSFVRVLSFSCVAFFVWHLKNYYYVLWQTYIHTHTHSLTQDHISVDFPALFNFSITVEGSTEPVTVTFFVSKTTSNESTPSTLAKMRFTAPTQPSHIISTLNSVVFADMLSQMTWLMSCCAELPTK